MLNDNVGVGLTKQKRLQTTTENRQGRGRSDVNRKLIPLRRGGDRKCATPDSRQANSRNEQSLRGWWTQPTTARDVGNADQAVSEVSWSGHSLRQVHDDRMTRNRQVNWTLSSVVYVYSRQIISFNTAIELLIRLRCMGTVQPAYRQTNLTLVLAQQQRHKLSDKEWAQNTLPQLGKLAIKVWRRSDSLSAAFALSVAQQPWQNLTGKNLVYAKKKL